MRICLYSGPGCGKTTTALWLTQELKILNYNVEYVSEWIKGWAFEKKEVKGWDQFHVLGQQIYQETRLLENGVEHIITDSPILMQCAYIERQRQPFLPICLDTADLYDDYYPAHHILLERGPFEYQQNGRWEDYEQALKMDHSIKYWLTKTHRAFTSISVTDRDKILSEVMQAIAK